MAVQAQYPSNVLFHNRNGQEMNNNNTTNKTTIGNDYSGLMLDQSQSQSQMFFHNNGVMNNNPRKRGREAFFNVGNGNGGSSTTTTSTAAPINLFSLQPQPPTLINLSQLHNQHVHQPNLVSTGLRLAFNEQQQLSTLLSEDLTCQIKQQRDEIDQFLQLQGDQLRRTLAERRQVHYRALLSVAEESATKRLREKETEVQKAVRRNAELEERVAQLRVEAQAWQNKARSQEATAAALQVQLQQAMMISNAQEEGVGCSGGGGGGGEADDAESAHVDPDRVLCSGPSCKACRDSSASVVLLPCRHLSLCSNCNATVDTCPVCFSYKTASVEVYLS